MVTLADSLVSSTSRAVQLRMRPDLTVKRQQYQGTSYWVVKEPIGLNYYRFHDEEYAILNMMDGQTSMEEGFQLSKDFADWKLLESQTREEEGYLLFPSGMMTGHYPYLRN